MTESPRDPMLERYIDAYRAAEPRRRQNPFADPRIAAHAAERARHPSSPLRRFFATSPLAPLAPALLALGIALAPSLAPSVSPVAMEAASPALMTGVAPSADAARSTATPAERPSDLSQVVAITIAVALIATALRRTRRRA